MLRENIDDRKANIKIERKTCLELDQECKNLKVHLMQEEKNRNQVKADLARDQRVMNSASIYSKELENERAVLLL